MARAPRRFRASVLQSECNRTEAQVPLPAIYDFLGYAPWEPPDGWLRQARRGMGLSRRRPAERDETSGDLSAAVLHLHTHTAGLDEFLCEAE